LSISLLYFFTGCGVKSYTLFQDKENLSKGIYEDVDIKFENKIMPRDRLDIKIYNIASGELKTDEQDNSKNNNMNLLPSSGKQGFLVTSDGDVILPILGKVNLLGLTTIEASEKLTKLYKKYIKNPYISVDILNKRLYILGEVNKPGVIPMQSEVMTIFEAIARAGDFSNYARRDNIKILRKVGSKYRMSTLDLTNFNAFNPSKVMLKRDDVVYVQPRGTKGVNVVVKDISPILGIISSTISTYASIKFLSED